MNEEEQRLYDVIADWWDEVFVRPQNPKTIRNDCIIDLFNSIMEWRNSDEYVEDPWNLRPRQPMEPVKKKQ